MKVDEDTFELFIQEKGNCEALIKIAIRRKSEASIGTVEKLKLPVFT